jgi:anthranilate phosphoribosyltransferase
MASQQDQLPQVDIKPLLSKLWPIDGRVTADEIADAISHFFTNQVTEAQSASLLMALHFTKLDFEAEVLARCAAAMQKACAQVPVDELKAVIEARGRKEGSYQGGLVSQCSLNAAG